MNLYEQLKSKEPLVVASHYDADGCYSAALLSTVFNIETIYFPWVFGDLSSSEDGVDLAFDIVLDLGAPLGDYDGIVIDHHRCVDNPKYTQVFMNIPTTGIVYEVFKDRIPDEHKWKVVGGLTGDGQPEKVPMEIWEMFPELLETRGKIYSSYAKFKEYPYPLYRQLSSPVNAMCRMGNPETAYEIICRAKTPFDILNNIAMMNDQKALNVEIKNLFKEGVMEYNVRHYCTVVIINSDKRIGSRVCSALGGMNSAKTWIVINEGTKKFSIRGDLADYIGAKLQDGGFTCGGHHGFYGGRLLNEQEGMDVIQKLRSTLK